MVEPARGIACGDVISTNGEREAAEADVGLLQQRSQAELGGGDDCGRAPNEGRSSSMTGALSNAC